MKAIILAGGLGLRLRPLTNNTTKPMLPLVNRPFVEYVISLLKQHGIRDLIFSTFYLSHEVQNYFGTGAKHGVNIEYCIEEKPLGTGGAVKNCESLLDKDEPFLIFNGDILTDLDMAEFINFHKIKGAVASVALGKVIDPTTYGMVDVEESGKALRWYEKPSWNEATSRWVNIGTCVLEPEILKYIEPNEQVSIERETFPRLIKDKKAVFGFQSNDYWLDIGTPAKFLKAQRNLLMGIVRTNLITIGEHQLQIGDNTKLHGHITTKGPVVIGNNCTIGTGTIIIGPTVIGDNVTIGSDALIEESSIWDDCVLEEQASMVQVILGREVILRKGATLKEGCVVEDKYVALADRIYTDDTILSHE